MVEVSTTAVPGLLIVSLEVHGDSRGWFAENWQREKMVAAGLPDVAMVQQNVSFNATTGTTRGLHAEPWDKYVSVPAGRALGAWVDLRDGDGFGRTVTCELAPGTAVFVPRGVANGFQTLEPETTYSYLVTDHWSAQARSRYTFVNLADETLGIDWPIPVEQAVVSEADRTHPRLGEVVPMPPSPVVILGAGGRLGSELVRQCRSRDIPHLAYTREQWDLGRPESWPVEHVRDVRAVINAAAYTAVDEAETTAGRRRAWVVNGTGVSALTTLCRRSDTPLVHVSTDYVFDGELPIGREYDVEAPLAPVSVYGQSKAAGEAAVRSWAKHHIVRTSWVIGQGGNFVSTMHRLAESGVDPRVVDDQHGRLTFAEDLAASILELVTSSAPYGTVHMTNSGPVMTWYQVAREVFARTGHDPDRVTPVSTAEYTDGAVTADRPIAARPKNSALAVGDLPEALRLPEQSVRLDDYLGAVCDARAAADSLSGSRGVPLWFSSSGEGVV